MKVREFMTTRIESVEAEGTVYDAVEKMVDRRIRSLLVTFSGDVENHGVITARDVVYKVLAKGINPNEIKVSQIASKPIHCVEHTATIDEAASILEKNRVGRIFVCESGKIIGVIALLDVMAAALVSRARGNHVSG